jgi:hypothetical protein
MSRIIYYYQTFCGLNDILKDDPINVSHIHISSIHFGKNKNGSNYIHLNDNNPEDKIFDNLWIDITKAYNKGIKIVLMVGGAGGAFTDLFLNFDIYYNLLKNTIKNHKEIGGIDLDIEETCDIDNVKMLIKKIDADFGKDFIISMAPVSNSLKTDCVGMGGFSYKELYNSNEGKRINYFNGQFYGDFGYESYKEVIINGYPQEKIIMGMLSGLYDPISFKNSLLEVKKIKNEYKNFGGVFVWEYIDCPPNKKDHGIWANEMNKIIKINPDKSYCIIL